VANPNPKPAPPETQFKAGWVSGKTKTVKIPIVLELQVKAIAHCIDRNPAIADQVLKFAQSLVEQK
jgi:hypothetical protein